MLEAHGKPVGIIAAVQPTALARFDIKQPVYYADIFWDSFRDIALQQKIQYREISKYPAVQRDLAIVVDQSLRYEAVEQATQQAHVNKLTHLELFDIFESDKLGAGKKSMAISFTFEDKEKTLTDKEIDSMMKKLMDSYEKHLQAEIRKG
jgi:phenylalanyl-tRNA synthetase beta chain